MKNVRIPDTDLTVSALCYGTADLGTRISEADGERVMAAFLEAGGNFFDTAHCYAFWVEGGGAGVSERTLARCLKRLGAGGSVVATKGGHPDGGEAYPRPDRYLAPEVIASDLDDSLERLERERIDLYWLHRDDARVPVGEVIDAMNREIERGRVRHIGASNWSIDRIEAANAYAEAKSLRGFAASQVQWSLAVPAWQPGPDPTTRYVTDEDALRYRGLMPVTAYSATAGGYFSAADRPDHPGETPINRARKQRAAALAQQIGCTPTQVALAYLLNQEGQVIPIFATGSMAHLKEAAGAANIALTPEQVRWLREG
ncbi:MAG: aldo/keto reductase [Armatimonadetes bacterium]|nr:aldo/keto reductase [Armatimonadota bacterium]